jgi:PTH2 family peptidyl-tRNA hydrolase
MDYKQVIVVRKDLNMRKGKMCAQASHASMMFLVKPGHDGRRLNVALSDDQIGWLDSPFTKIVCGAESEQELRDVIAKGREAGLVVHEVIDAGRTEFNGVPTLTCAAFGPHEENRFEGVTSYLKLL